MWESVEETDPKYVKRVEYGTRVFDAVDAYYRLKLATELWGPYGKTWGLYDIEYRFHENLAILKGVFKYPDGEFPISNSIKVDTEFAKKIETDTITKALSRLGFCADVYMGRFEDSTYVSEVRQRYREEERKAILIYTMDKYRQEIDAIKAALQKKLDVELAQLEASRPQPAPAGPTEDELRAREQERLRREEEARRRGRHIDRVVLVGGVLRRVGIYHRFTLLLRALGG